MSSLFGPIWKSLVFVVATLLATAVLAFTIQNGGAGGGTTYHAIFTDAPSVNSGDDVRIHGVRVGQVSDVEIADRRFARITFTVDKNVALSSDARAAIRFRNLIGQRYLTLVQGDDKTRLQGGGTIPLPRTEPALDLTELFNGFQPLFRMLEPKDINALSEQIIAVFQGEGSTVEGLIRHTGSLASTLAGRDKVIGELITNLSSVLEVMGKRSDELSGLVVTLQQLVSGLAKDRVAIGSAVASMGELTTSVSGLLQAGRDPLRKSIGHLGALSGNLSASEKTLDQVFTTWPQKLEKVGRTAGYGSWVNFYLCEVAGPIPDVEGYLGDRGADAAAGRCS